MNDMLGRAQFRMSISSLVDGETVEAQYNPVELQEAIEVGWGRQEVPGASHRPLQFSSTGNETANFELTFQASTTEELDRLETARKLLLSWCYPIRAENVASGAPPKLLFVWPGLMVLTCVLTGLNIRHTRFDRDGRTTAFVATVALEEYREGRIYSEQVAMLGTVRSSGVVTTGDTDTVE